MKTQRLEYLDTLNILFSGRSATGPQAAGINKILAPPEEIPIDPELRNTDNPEAISDSDIEQHHGRDNTPSTPQNIIKEKSAPSGNSIRRGKNKMLMLQMIEIILAMVKKLKDSRGGSKLHLKWVDGQHKMQQV